MDYRLAIKTLLDTEFDQAQAAFRRTPGGDNWTRLEQAMWALQGAPYLTDEQVEHFANKVGIAFIPLGIAKLHRGKEQR